MLGVLQVMINENSNNRISKIYVRFWWGYIRSDVHRNMEINRQIII
jgi:hypothetical protein